jgi:exosortase A-associated hydrolase 2
MASPAHTPAEPFFLASAPGERFCLYHAAHGDCRGALVYVHPFAEEMNKARRMAALTARALAANGYAVLLLDLHGCGDSDGDFGDARWEQWKADIAAASAWLAARSGRPVGLWGLRLGALLALDYARGAAQPVAQLLLWQPVTAGAAFLTQFLRLRLAGAMLDPDAAGATTAGLRAELAGGAPLEVAGYLLAPQLAAALDTLDAATLAPPCPTDWLEIVAAPERPLPPAAARVAAAWQGAGAALAVHGVACAPFWSTQEIAECPALIAATCAALEARHER